MWFQTDVLAFVVLEPEPSSEDGFLGVENLVPELFCPFGQQPQNRRVIDLELGRLDVFV